MAGEVKALLPDMKVMKGTSSYSNSLFESSKLVRRLGMLLFSLGGAHFTYAFSATSNVPPTSLGSGPAVVYDSANGPFSTLTCVCLSPAVYVLDGFLSKDECEALVADTDGPYGDLVLEDMLSRVAEITAAPMTVYESRRFLAYDAAPRWSSRAAPIAKDDARRRLPHGLHVDTNNGRVLRHISALVYLDDVDAEANGGSTIFPLAGAADDDPALHAAKALLANGITHTDGVDDLTNDFDERTGGYLGGGGGGGGAYHIQHLARVFSVAEGDNDDGGNDEADGDKNRGIEYRVGSRNTVEEPCDQQQRQEQQRSWQRRKRFLEAQRSLLLHRGAQASSSSQTSPDQERRGGEGAPAPPGVGLCVPPRQGRLCLFFNVDDDGVVDARSWHGSEGLWPESRMPPKML